MAAEFKTICASLLPPASSATPSAVAAQVQCLRSRRRNATAATAALGATSAWTHGHGTTHRTDGIGADRAEQRAGGSLAHCHAELVADRLGDGVHHVLNGARHQAHGGARCVGNEAERAGERLGDAGSHLLSEADQPAPGAADESPRPGGEVAHRLHGVFEVPADHIAKVVYEIAEGVVGLVDVGRQRRQCGDASQRPAPAGDPQDCHLHRVEAAGQQGHHTTSQRGLIAHHFNRSTSALDGGSAQFHGAGQRSPGDGQSSSGNGGLLETWRQAVKA